MLRNPRPSSRSGLSTQGTLLLALAGVGVVVFLFFLFPRMTSSRAAAPRRVLPDEPTTSVEVRSSAVEPTPLAQAVLTTAAPNDPTTESSATSAPASVQSEELLASADVEEEGPKLRHIQGHGKAGTIEPGALRAEHRERRKARREAEAAQARALGIAPPEPQAVQTAPNPNRSRLKQEGAKGNKGGQRKPKKQKPKEEEVKEE